MRARRRERPAARPRGARAPTARWSRRSCRPPSRNGGGRAGTRFRRPGSAARTRRAGRRGSRRAACSALTPASTSIPVRPASTKPSPPGVTGSARAAPRDVREQHERRVGPGADGGEAADEREVVEAGLADRAREREVPARAEGAPDPVALCEQSLRQVAARVPLRRVPQDPARGAADEQRAGGPTRSAMPRRRRLRRIRRSPMNAASRSPCGAATRRARRDREQRQREDRRRRRERRRRRVPQRRRLRGCRPGRASCSRTRRRGGPAGDDAAGRAARKLRGADREPARRAERDPLQLPQRDVAHRLEHDGEPDPGRLRALQLRPGLKTSISFGASR